tara:strand:+ start:546 stop:650 length:105 start_codon:yes stop_codon:yes gene_type:complete
MALTPGDDMEGEDGGTGETAVELKVEISTADRAF